MVSAQAHDLGQGGMAMMKQIYLPLLTYPDAAKESLLDNAVELATNLGATLHATIIDVSIPPITNPWPILLDTDDMIRRAERTSRREGEGLARALKRRCDDANLSSEIASIVVEQPKITDVAAEEARLYDVTLTQSASQFASLAEALIFGAGRPVILFPDRSCSGRIDHVAIAWDGSRAAARAVADANCFIEGANKASIICAPHEKPIDLDAAGKLAASLGRRGMTAEVHVLQAQARSIGEAIQARAVELKADLLVMGGFGHSRLREFVLGGVTADVLSNAMLPVLMSH
jgi:nucleotide-binding universal stress UspA family protein